MSNREKVLKVNKYVSQLVQVDCNFFLNHIRQLYKPIVFFVIRAGMFITPSSSKRFDDSEPL